MKTSANLITDQGVSSAGLITIVLPATNAGNAFHAGIAIGKFQGVIAPMTPIGCLIVITIWSFNSDGFVSPANRLPSPAA